MMNLPDDIILLFLSKLDLLSFVRFSMTCKRYQYLSKAPILWKNICFSNPLLRQCVDLLKLNNELLNHQFDVKLFCKSIFKKDLAMLKTLITDRTLTVYVPSYESRNYTIEFFPAKQGQERKVFISEQVARTRIINIKSVCKFITIEIPVHSINFIELCEKGELIINHLFANATPNPPMTPNTYNVGNK